PAIVAPEVSLSPDCSLLPPEASMVILLVTTGRPFASPKTGLTLLGLVSLYVHPWTRLMVPPPLALAASMAATSPSAPPPGPVQGTVVFVEAEAVTGTAKARARSGPAIAAASFSRFREARA